MSSGTQVDLDWAGSELPSPDNGQLGGAGTASVPATGRAPAKYLTDEEILGLEPSAPERGSGAVVQLTRGGESAPKNDADSAAVDSVSSRETSIPGSKDPGYSNVATAEMPAWMAAAAADPRHSEEAQELWREHQEFRAAFASPEEARAVKELLPGGVRDVLSLREATQSVERIDAALFSGDARSQAEVVAELARANPAAFRSMFAEAAKVLAGMQGSSAGSTANQLTAAPTLRKNREGWGTQNSEANSSLDAGRESRGDDARSHGDDDPDERRRHRGEGHPPGSAPPPSQGANDPPPGDPPDMSGGSVVAAPTFDPAAYAQFERATNDTVARDVRGSIHETLSRVMPEGVAEGAARRIGEDIFHEVHRALAADRTLSEQVASVLRSRRFGEAEQQRVASLLARRAKQLVPSVARRVIGEWTSTVLGTARSKSARQAAAASRVDIAAPGGSLDSTPLRPMAQREVNYASMSDEEILGM